MAGQPTKYKIEYNEQVRKLCLLGATDKDLANFFDVCEKTIDNWKNTESQFLQSLKDGKINADSDIATSLYKRAKGFRYDEVTKELIHSSSQKSRHNNKDITLSEEDWECIKETFNEQCAYCGSMEKLTKDHIIPLVKGGKYEKPNIVPACTRCNSSKKDNDIEQWYKKQKFYSQEKAEYIAMYVTVTTALNSHQKLTVTKTVTKEVAPDTGAAMAWLKNRRPKDWRDKHEIEHSGKVNIYETMTDAELDKAIEANESR
jgi:5-methylcytosine-specific restriction endonuclease McrA